MSKLLKLFSILLLFFSLNCAERMIIIERPNPNPPPSPAKNYGQEVASQKHLSNGKKFYHQGKYAKALQEFKKAVIADPRNFEARYYLGLCYQKLDHYKESISEFELCMEVENGDKLFISKVRFSLAYSLELTDELEKSEVQYQLAYSLDPDNKAAYKGIERVKEKRGKLTKVKITEK
ncbi:MAG: tetratricopeptide repeat protein [candidate division Zixibacteria bacterium]|nr:tetratricopeptide repeat protein [candidate division Zixibacteria bacterium]